MKLAKLILLRLKLYFKNPTLVLSFTVFLIALWTVLNFARSNQQETLIIPIAVIDLDQSEYSRLIIEGVSKKETVYMVALSESEALKQVSTGKLEAVYILKEGLMDHILDSNLQEIIEIIKSPVSLSAEIIGELFSAEIIRLSSNVDAANSVVKSYGSSDSTGLWKEAWDHTDAYWKPSPVITIDYSWVNQSPSNNQDIQVTSQIKNNIIIILIMSLILFSILITSRHLLKEKDMGIIKRVVSTGTPLWIYLLSSILSIVIIHVLGFVTIYTFITFIKL